MLDSILLELKSDVDICFLLELKSHNSMALLSELAKQTANTLKVDEKSVALYARYLREAGLVSKKGRGRGAAQVIPRDASNLLLAIMASPEIKDAAECVKRIRGAKFSGIAQGTDVDQVGLPDIPFLWRGGKKPTQRGEKNLLLPLGDVLDEILGGDFMIPDPEIGVDVPMLNFSLTVHRPGSRAELEISDGSRHWKIQYSEFIPLNKKKQFIEQIPPRPWGMQTKTMVGLDEMLAIRDILEPKQGKKQE